MPPKDQVNRIIVELQALAEALGDVADLEDRTKAAQADYDSCQQSLVKIKGELADSQAQLSQAQRNAQKQFEQDMFNKQRALQELSARVKTLEECARELTDEVQLKGSQLASIENAMNEARRKLAG